jgi:hypothetical protein
LKDSNILIDDFQNFLLPKKMVNWTDITMGGDPFREAVIFIENTEIVYKKLEFNFMYFDNIAKYEGADDASEEGESVVDDDRLHYEHLI